MRDQNVTTQAMMMEKTGWTKAKMSQLYNFKQDFNSEILSEASNALNIRPYELLMHPEDAHALRRVHGAAVHLASDRRAAFISEPEDASDGQRRKTG